MQRVNAESDCELVERACRGDIEGLGRLYDRYYASTVGVALAVLGDRHLAEDAAQETFAVACRSLPRLKEAKRFGPWLGAICRNVARDMAKARVRQSALRPAADDPCDAGDDARTALVHEAVMRLPDANREVVLLHYFSGLRHEEIGRLLGISPQAVHGRLQRARRRIAAELKRRGLEAGGVDRGRKS